MPERRLTRRQAFELGAAAAALGLLPAGRAIAAPRGPEAFSLALASPSRARAASAGWHTTEVLSAPRRFDLIGLDWRPGGPVAAQVRARRRGGSWTPWTVLHAGAEHAPDAGRRSSGTEPVWTGAADQFQLRLEGDPRGLHARFVRSGPAARAAGRRARMARRQLPGAPAVIPRAQWGGDAVSPRSAPAFGQVQLAFVHHTATASAYGPADSAAIVLGIAKYHRDHNGWSDVGYNFLVDQYGQIFEGRAGGLDQAIVGAQVQGFNSVSTGVACLGTFTSAAPADAGMEALARLIGWKLSLHGVPVQGTVTVTSAGGPVNRFASGTPVTFERISGHRDGGVTTCPGNALYGRLGDLRARAAAHSRPAAGIVVRASSTRVRGPVASVISGTLRFADGSPPGGATVEILYAAGGAAFTRLAGATCAPDGQWSATVTLPRTGAVRARFPGDGIRPPVESVAVTITVVPTLALGLSARRVRRGRRVAVSGVLTPATAATQVSLYLQRRVGRRWVTVRRRTVAVRAGRFLQRLRPSRPGVYRVSVGVPGATARSTFRVSR